MTNYKDLLKNLSNEEFSIFHRCYSSQDESLFFGQERKIFEEIIIWLTLEKERRDEIEFDERLRKN